MYHNSKCRVAASREERGTEEAQASYLFFSLLDDFPTNGKCSDNADKYELPLNFYNSHHDASCVRQVAARISAKMTETDTHEPHDGPAEMEKGLFSHTSGQS
ncbi:hypothetical protein Ddc_21998 [Ditylenchus destructor]|nr:hypothetical protein Ddc_21998 [Ditylenchus destructor]